jgi:hypothetical protein
MGVWKPAKTPVTVLIWLMKHLQLSLGIITPKLRFLRNSVYQNRWNNGTIMDISGHYYHQSFSDLNERSSTKLLGNDYHE